ncbi:MAG: P1 family peptidase [Chloroflexi bacterium]|nr:P1 family peptidase [Chloroflexota bacterium]
MKGHWKNSLTDIPGVKVGHAHDDAALTGCTVVLCEAGMVGGVDQRGGAPGTRETDLLHPLNLVDQVHAVVLAGGSSFGLAAADGVVRYLEERNIGFDAQAAKVPIVPGAIIFDLGIGRSDIRPDAQMGYQACLNASDGIVPEGNVGAGCGATVGKMLGMGQAMKSGIGTASIEIRPGLIVAALVVVNALGDIINPENGRILAGVRRIDHALKSSESPFMDSLEVMKILAEGPLRFAPTSNTTIGVVATNARLSKVEVNKVAQMAQDGLARAVRPVHTMLDGDTIFALASGEQPADVNLIGAFAAQAVSRAIVRAVQAASPAGGLPSASSLQQL